MSTLTLSVTNNWTNIAADTDGEVLVTWLDPICIEFAVTDTASPPTVSGHRFYRETPLTRSMIGAGFLWARNVPENPGNTFSFTVTTNPYRSVAVTGASSPQSTEDAALPADPAGVALIARRRDNLVTTEVSADGDAIALNSTNRGELRTNDALLNIGVGAPADAAASSDTGTFSVLALIKRGLTNWTTLLARVPVLVTGRMPVDGSGVTQPVSAAALPLPAGASTSALQTTANASLASVDTKLPTATIPGLLPVDALAGIGVARQLTALVGNTNVALTTTCRRISIFARGADMRYVIGVGAQTASGSSHWIGQNERLDIDVPANANIAVIRAGAVDGTLEISELVIA